MLPARLERGSVTFTIFRLSKEVSDNDGDKIRGDKQKADGRTTEDAAATVNLVELRRRRAKEICLVGEKTGGGSWDGAAGKCECLRWTRDLEAAFTIRAVSSFS